MRKIDDGDGIREQNIADLVAEFQDDVLWLDKGDLDEVEWQLATSQYAYIKFGLILEKVRNQSLWSRCVEKFNDFRQFCQQKVNLSIWQVANAIKSAQVAVKLVFLGFADLPRNASQALKLADLSSERLGEVWTNVLKNCEGHKITADAISREVNPDAQPTNSTLRLPTAVVEGLQQQAIERGLTLNEYLERLANGEQLDECPKADPIDCADLNAAQLEVLDRVESQWLKPMSTSIEPQRVVDSAIDRFDELMNGLIGKFIPKVDRRVAHE